MVDEVCCKIMELSLDETEITVIISLLILGLTYKQAYSNYTKKFFNNVYNKLLRSLVNYVRTGRKQSYDRLVDILKLVKQIEVSVASS